MKSLASLYPVRSQHPAKHPCKHGASLATLLATFVLFLLGIPSARAQQWTNVLGGSTQSHRGMHVSADGTRYVVGDNGQLTKWDINNNGLPVTSIGTSNNLYAVHALNNGSIVYVVGEHGTIFKSTDGGGSWSDQSVSYNGGILGTIRPDLFDVHFIDANKGAAVGETGNVFTTQDGGATWVRRGLSTTGTSETLRAVVMRGFSSALWIFAYGDNGTHVFSSNGGTDWITPTQASVFGSTNLTGADIAADDTICVVGGGTVFRSTNLTDYSTSYPPSAISLQAVSLADYNNIVVAGNSGQIFTTEDGGSTWVPYSTGNSHAITCVSMPNPQSAWAAAERNFAGTWQFSNFPALELSYFSTPYNAGAILNFGTVQENTTSYRTYTITNNGTGTLRNLFVSEDSSQYSIYSAPASSTLAPGASTYFTVAFTPTSTGTKTATLYCYFNSSGSPYTYGLTGVGSITPVPDPRVFLDSDEIPDQGEISFGRRSPDSRYQVEITISNFGTGDLTNLFVRTLNDRIFSTSQPAVSTIGPGGSTTFTVYFSPDAYVSHTRDLFIDSNAGTHTITLKGSGTGSRRQLLKLISRYKGKLRIASRKKQVTRVKAFKKLIKRLKRRLHHL